MELLFNEHRVSVLQDQKVLEMDGGWRHNDMNILKATERYT